MDDSPADLSHQAILAALSSNWEEALKINQQIINLSPTNVEALNRLGRACFELGNLKESKKHFTATLQHDSYNQIAIKFIKKIEAFSKKGGKMQTLCRTGITTPINSDIFLEEPGKTKVVALLKVAEPQKLSLLSACVPVNLVIKNRGVTATTQNNEYLGVLPDDLSHRLIRLMHGGNKYEAFIKTTKLNGLSILIREVFRSVRFKNQPSFLDGLNTVLTYSSDHILVPDENEESFEGEEEEAV